MSNRHNNRHNIYMLYAKHILLQILSINPGYFQNKTICRILSGEISNENEVFVELLSETYLILNMQ
jgi:hypothetical protein